MRISELARRSGVSVPTIKYYLRTGLLPSGVATARNQAIYSDAHLRRLRLIRTLREIGGLSVRTTRNVLAALHQSETGGQEALSIINAGRDGNRSKAFQGTFRASAVREVAALAARRHWDPHTHQRDLSRLADVHVVARLLDLPEVGALTEEYAELASQLAQRDIALARDVAARITMGGRAGKAVTEEIITAVVLTDAIVSALHNIARNAELSRLFAELASSQGEQSAPPAGRTSR